MSVNLEDEVLDDEEIAEALDDLDGWKREDNAIEKTFTHNSFLEAIAFVNRVAVAAEKLDHHPDFVIHYKQVTLRCWTHKKNAITKADVTLAKEIEAVV
jgi:4a-hydroxytetrahydrobiopterin dehydratase